LSIGGTNQESKYISVTIKALKPRLPDKVIVNWSQILIGGFGIALQG
jgi:hypothetical protein